MSFELKTKDEVQQALSREKKWGAPHYKDPTMYHAYYDCGCGSQHDLDIPEYDYIACGGGFFTHRFLLKCPNDWYTLVVAKGMLPTKITEDWFCKGKLFRKYEDLLYDKMKT
jgi:hypothetical protein